MRSWHRRGWAGPMVAVALVVGLAAGCGSGSGTTNVSDSGTSSGGGGGGGGGSPDEGLAWVPFGPNDPDIPTPSWPAYNPFANGDCAGLQAYVGGADGQSLGDYGRAMVALCAAAVEGRQDQWDVAAQAFAAGDPASLANDCLSGLVSGLLERALAWHRRHPGQKPAVRFQRVADKTDCGRAGDPNTTAAPPTDTEAPPTDTEAPPTETTG